MSVVAAGPPDLNSSADRSHGSLLRAELRRITHRRFIRWLVVLGALGYALVLAISYNQYANKSAETLAEGQAKIQQFVDEQNAYREVCLTEVPATEAPENYCPPVATAEDWGDAADYVSKQPFSMNDDLPGIAVGIAVMVAGLSFLVGATWIGAEWAQKTLAALLFWEPRRLRVYWSKVAVLAAGVMLVALAAQAAWLAFGFFLASAKGSTATEEGLWGDVVALEARAIGLALILSLMGFGIATLIRNTGAALGVGFVYFVAEVIAQGVRPEWQEWYLTTNVGAFLIPGGLEVSIPSDDFSLDEYGNFTQGTTLTLSNLHGGLVLGGVAVVLIVLGLWQFRRRDLT